MRDKVNVAVIGCGRIAQMHLQALVALEDARLVAVADIRADAAHRTALHFHCQAYTDYKELIENNDLDAVFVCTPPSSHAEISVYALQHGLHVLCEKPFAIDSESALQMVRAAQQSGCLITMASKFRFVDDVVQAKQLIASGLLGEIVLFELSFCSYVDMRDRWNAQKEISGGGVLIDNGSHAVDIVRCLLGPIARVQARHGKRVQELEVEDTSMLLFETRTNVWGRIDLSWSIHKDTGHYINVYGSDRMLAVGWRRSWYRRNGQGDHRTFGRGYDKLQAFVKQHRHFLDCVRGRAELIIDAIDGLASVRVIESAYQSAKLNTWMEVGEYELVSSQ